MTVAKAISTIIEKCGEDILDSPEMVQAMVMDYASGHEREIQLFCLSCQKGILSFAHKMLLMKDETKIREVAMKAKAKLEYDAFMAEEHALYSVNMLLNGLGFSFEIISEYIGEKKMQEGRGGSINLNQKREGCNGKENKTLLLYDKKNEVDENLLQNLRKLASAGDVDAALSLGNSYYYGIGVEKDWIIAETYYRKVKDFGNEEEKREAKRMLIEIFNRQQTISENED